MCEIPRQLGCLFDWLVPPITRAQRSVVVASLWSLWDEHHVLIILLLSIISAYLLLIVTLSIVTRQRRKALETLAYEHALMEQRIQERTAALQATNRLLMDEVAERKRTERALYESEARFRSYFELPLVGSAITSLEKGWLEVSAGLCAMLGYSAQELMGLTWAELTHPADLAADVTQFNRMLAGNIDSYALEKRFIRKNGALIWVNLAVGCVRKPDRSVEYTIALLQDSTERKHAEEALRESEANLKALIENTDSSIWSVDTHYGLIIGNHTFHQNIRTAIGRTFAYGECVLVDAIPVANRELWRTYYDRVLRGEAFELELKGDLIHQTQWTEYRFSPIRSAESIIGVTVMGRDITARKEAEAALQYQADLLANVNDAIVASDVNYRLTAWNAAAEAIYGWKAEEVLGRIGLDLLQTEFPETDKAKVLKTITTTGRYRGETTQVRKDGTRFPVEVASIVLHDDQGQITGYLSVNRDITARKQAEAVQIQLSAIVESSDDAIIGKTLEGKIISWNAGAEHLYGYTAEEVIGQSLSLLLPPERHDDLPHILNMIKHGKHLHNFETTRQTKDGRIIDVSLSISPIKTATGQLLGASTIAHDISERKRIEESERQQRTLAEALRDTAVALNSTLQFDAVLDRILENVGRVVPHDAANVMLLDAEGTMVSIVRSRGYSEPHAQQNGVVRFSLATLPILRQIMDTRHPVAIPQTQTHPAWRDNSIAQWVRSYAGAPIRIRERTVGFLNVDSATPRFFTIDHAERLQAFADQASIAIENARLYAEVQELAITDPLTGVFNRRGLFQLGEREVERALRFHDPLSVAMLDLDHFKQVNDTYGHPIGDRVLHKLAACCRMQMRNVDVLARYGGEEFILLLPETDLANATQVAERVRESIATLVVSAEPNQSATGKTVHITVSLGVASLTPEMSNLATLIEHADHALYCAKRAGRNCVVAG